ncbi:hypothetical protein FA13DRAFT_1731129 [Coprinellus micaceus]|uniref:Uncharacterized protein n=1 Tax=Coprinellus micaceus TaxID=71717 RepID=A0A4Y7TGF1_COPMI|nr:hypothetical protein FA13DRAFT_1731129 [Coprinellus micaceus]
MTLDMYHTTSALCNRSALQKRRSLVVSERPWRASTLVYLEHNSIQPSTIWASPIGDIHSGGQLQLEICNKLKRTLRYPEWKADMRLASGLWRQAKRLTMCSDRLPRVPNLDDSQSQNACQYSEYNEQVLARP